MQVMQRHRDHRIDGAHVCPSDGEVLVIKERKPFPNVVIGFEIRCPKCDGKATYDLHEPPTYDELMKSVKPE